jgi:hypothetical protein
MKKGIWLTFDLGVRGDYESMYEFLDTHGAKECGDSVALLQYEFRNDLLAELKKELARCVEFDRRARVYVIYPAAQGKYKGRFLFGGRKSPPWTGYKKVEVEEEDSGD